MELVAKPDNLLLLGVADRLTYNLMTDTRLLFNPYIVKRKCTPFAPMYAKFKK